YAGQSYHVPVAVDAARIAALTAEELLAGFATAYRTKYGYYYDDVPVELVNLHVTGVAGAESHAVPEHAMSGGDPSKAMRKKREAWSAMERRFVNFVVYQRDLLRPGMMFEGPCLIEEDSATTVVDAGARVTIDRYGSLDISRNAVE